MLGRGGGARSAQGRGGAPAPPARGVRGGSRAESLPPTRRRVWSSQSGSASFALHAARFSCLSLSLYHLEVGWSLCVVSPANSVRVCLRTCFTTIVSCLTL